MRFLINDLIIYDANLKILMNVNFEEDPVELTPGSVAILLDFFISHPHVVWSKTEIGEQAFANSPYSGSESNVNKSLSLLRRSFRDAGEDSGIISTMPSLGVVFNASVRAYEADVSPLPIQTISLKRNLNRPLFLTALAGMAVIILCFSVMKYKKPTECILITRGDPVLFHKLTENITDMKNCRAPGVIINGVQKTSENRKNHSLLAKCDDSSRSCLNFITK
ncbi:winged helix-turn-helix domain-containing protein [Serratia inhibens]